jgi:hypothetical protein
LSFSAAVNSRIAALAPGVDSDVDELRTEGCRLFLGFRAYVVAFDDRGQPLRGCELLQPSNTEADHQDGRGTQ